MPKKQGQERRLRNKTKTLASSIPTHFEHSTTRYIINGIILVLLIGYGVRKYMPNSNALVNPDQVEKIVFCNEHCSAWDAVPFYDIYRAWFMTPMMTCSLGNCTANQPRHIACINQGKNKQGIGPMWKCEAEPTFGYDDLPAYAPSWELKSARLSCHGDKAMGNCQVGTFHLEYEWDFVIGECEIEAAHRATHAIQMMLRIEHWPREE
jgi:hypothetical protein